MMKRSRLMGATLALLFAAGSSHAATVSITGPAEVNKFTDPTFQFSVTIDDIAPLTNIDGWNLSLLLHPPLNGAKFAGAVGPTEPGYVFLGDSWSYDVAVIGGDNLVASDLTISASGVSDSDAVGKLLAKVTVDISAAALGDYAVDLEPSQSFLFDPSGAVGDFILAETYKFTVVPVPAAALLFGSGLIGLLGLVKMRKSV